MGKKLFKLKTEKVIVNGEKGRKITGWNNCMKKSECPEPYLENSPYFYETDAGKLYVNNGGILTGVHIGKGDTVTEETFDDLMSILHEAGDRMHEIRQKIKKLENEWVGENETIVV